MISGVWWLQIGINEIFSRISINSKAELFLWVEISFCTSDLKPRNPQYSKNSLVGECDVFVPALVKIKLAPNFV